MAIEYSRDGDTVDLIAQRRFKATAGVTEAILALNPGLAAHGVFLPEGLAVTVPDGAPKKTVRNVKRLWS